MKVKLFTHTDLDGVGCGIVAKYKFDDIDISYCNYDDINYEVSKFIALESEKYDKIFITDISVNKLVAEEINEHISEKVNLIDHHATAIWLNKYDWANVNDLEMSIYPYQEEYMKSSGTSLFYDHLWDNYELHNSLLVEFIEKVRRYDTWEWSTKYDDLHAKQLNDLLYIIGRDKFIERFTNDASIELSKNEKLILEIEQNRIDAYVKKKNEDLKVIDILGYKAGLVFVEQFKSQLGNELAKLHQDLDFIVMVDVGNKTISYRGIKDNIDLGKDVAKVFGGGGHPKASGSEINDETVNEIISLIFDK